MNQQGHENEWKNIAKMLTDQEMKKIMTEQIVQQLYSTMRETFCIQDDQLIHFLLSEAVQVYRTTVVL